MESIASVPAAIPGGVPPQVLGLPATLADVVHVQSPYVEGAQVRPGFLYWGPGRYTASTDKYGDLPGEAHADPNTGVMWVQAVSRGESGFYTANLRVKFNSGNRGGNYQLVLLTDYSYRHQTRAGPNQAFSRGITRLYVSGPQGDLGVDRLHPVIWLRQLNNYQSEESWDSLTTATVTEFFMQPNSEYTVDLSTLLSLNAQPGGYADAAIGISMPLVYLQWIPPGFPGPWGG